MKGNIYTSERCKCGSILQHSEDKRAFVCKKSGYIKHVQNVRVKFGRQASKRFQSYKEAAQFLAGLRYETVKGTFDKRDYQKDNPLGFETQVEKYKSLKKQKASKSHYGGIKTYLNAAVEVWGQRNVKKISYGDIEDFLYGYRGGEVKDKTRANICSVLHDFFKWLKKREAIPIPEFPEISYNLGWRNIIDVELQQKIIDEVARICPIERLALGIRWLSTYVAIRPAEMRSLKESQIDVNGFFVLPGDQTKERKPKLVPMLEEDAEIYHTYPPGLPDMYFFRHTKDFHGAKAGAKHGRSIWNDWWKRACKNLKVEGVDMYGGTRHSSASALSEQFTAEHLREFGTMHATNKAFDRYCQGERPGKIEVSQVLKSMQKKQPGKVIELEKIRKEVYI